jgi:LmbE family N-acetylglucosaminyl deacetylase
MRSRLISGALLCFWLPAAAQDAVERRQAFLDLENDGVVMNLSAHPDDEDGATLALYRMRHGAKTHTVLFTRGEGGQNEKGSELYEELGVLRSDETASAGRILGAEVHFLNFPDFGYSKTATETFRQWGGQQEALRRLVFVIRKYRPDVLFTNHNTIDGHGHHQAAAIAALAAFDAAADSAMFPEQFRIAGIAPWQPRKLYFRAWGRFEPAADVSNPVGEVDSLRGVSYLEIAARALREHRTQGMERVTAPGLTRWKSLYRLVRSSSLFARDTTSFFGGMDLWRDHSLEPLRAARGELSAVSAGEAPGVTLRRVSRLMMRLDSLGPIVRGEPLAERILAAWGEELENVAARTAELRFTASFRDTVLTPGQKVECTLELKHRGSTLRSVAFALDLPAGWASMPAGAAAGMESGLLSRFLVAVGSNATFTLPRVVAQYRPLESREAVTARARFELEGLLLKLRTSPVFDVAPPEILAVRPEVTCLSPAQLASGLVFGAEIRSYLPEPYESTVTLVSPAGWGARALPARVAGGNGPGSTEVRVSPPPNLPCGEYALRFSTPRSEAVSTVRVFDVSVPSGLRVGVVKSYDNTFEIALRDLGIEFGLLSESDLRGGDLSGWHTILVDIRAYLVREDLRAGNARLLEYARRGGHLVVMYQREQEWRPEYAPFPFTLSRRRITMEDAPVTVLEPEHPLFARPNRITDADWRGWKQERALYLPADVPAEYRRLVSSHDADEAEETTGYLLADVGRGSYLYTSFVWYRQLKEHLPGAVRAFANMVSYPLVRR